MAMAVIASPDLRVAAGPPGADVATLVRTADDRAPSRARLADLERREAAGRSDDRRHRREQTAADAHPGVNGAQVEDGVCRPVDGDDVPDHIELLGAQR